MAWKPRARGATLRSPVRGSFLGLAAAVALLVPTFSGAQPTGITAPLIPLAPPAQTAGAVKILVNKDGWYKVTDTQLQALGFTYPLAPPDRYKLHLYKAGVTEVPMRVRRHWIEFYGEGQDTRFTDTQTYWLVTGALGAPRIPNVRSVSPPGSPTGSFPSTVKVTQRITYSPGILNGIADNWFGRSVRAGLTRTVDLVAGNVDPSQTGSLQVTLQAAVNSDPSHSAHAALTSSAGTTDLGDMTWTGSGSGTGTFLVPAGAAASGTNTVTLTHNANPDIGLIDTVQLTYPHLFMADNNTLDFTATAGQPVTVGGFTGADVRMIDISNPLSPRELTPSITPDGGQFKATLNPPTGTTRVLAFLSSGIPVISAPKVLMDTPSNLHGASGANLLVISYGPFMSAAAPLVTFRQNAAGGSWNALHADVQDVYDEFGGGNHGPQAIADYLQFASTNYSPAPTHVLLVGDGSNDPRGYCVGNSFCSNQSGNTDLVPTEFVDTQFTESPDDDAMSPSTLGPGGLQTPTIAIGRLPANSAGEVTGMINKIMAYQQRPVRNPRDAFLVSDNAGDYDFASFSTELRVTTLQHPTVVPPITVTEEIRDPSNDPQTHTDIINGLNQGPTIVNYFGHGAVTRWANGTILQSSDAATLTNASSPSLYLMMTCLNGYFVDPAGDLPPSNGALGEALLRASGGAVAVWGSSGETFPDQQRVATNKALDELIRSSTKTLGQAMLTAKGVLSGSAGSDVQRTWNLFGDPTTTLR